MLLVHIWVDTGFMILRVGARMARIATASLMADESGFSLQGNAKISVECESPTVGPGARLANGLNERVVGGWDSKHCVAANGDQMHLSSLGTQGKFNKH